MNNFYAKYSKLLITAKREKPIIKIVIYKFTVSNSNLLCIQHGNRHIYFLQILYPQQGVAGILITIYLDRSTL